MQPAAFSCVPFGVLTLCMKHCHFRDEWHLTVTCFLTCLLTSWIFLDLPAGTGMWLVTSDYVYYIACYTVISVIASWPWTWTSQWWRIMFEARPRGLTFTWWGCCGLCPWHKLTELAHSFLVCSCVCFCLCGPFNCISFHKFSRKLSAFSICSSGINSAELVLSTIYLFMKVALSPDI